MAAWRSAGFSGGGLPEGELPTKPRAFWTSFLGDDREPLLAYSNGVYLVTRYGDLLRYRGTVSVERGRVYAEQEAAGLSNRELIGKTDPLRFYDGITGTGDLEAATALSVFLSKMGVNVRPKRSLLLSSDDLRAHHIIFLGSSFDNPILRDMIPVRERFVFDYHAEERNPGLWRNPIRDLDRVKANRRATTSNATPRRA